MSNTTTAAAMTRQQIAGLAKLIATEGRMPSDKRGNLKTGVNTTTLHGLRVQGLIACTTVYLSGTVTSDFAITAAGREAAFANAVAEDTRESNGLLVGRRKAVDPAAGAKRKALALARKLGVRIEESRDRENLEHEITVDAPAGQVWKASNVHELVCAGADGTPLGDLWIDLAERMSYGVEACDDDACDICHEIGGAQ